MSASARDATGPEGASGSLRPTAWMGKVSTLTVLDLAVVSVVLLLTTVAYVWAHANHVAVLRSPAFPEWWQWNDQSKYLRAMRAWLAGDLSPALHWYFPGYPLLGAAFSLLTPTQPFYLADLLCLLAFGAAFAQVAGRLAPDLRFARAGGALVFLVTVPLASYELKSFVEPWTTTPTAPLTLFAILQAFRLWDRPTSPRAAMLGLLTASVILFRPVDVAPLLLAMVASSAVALRHQWRSFGRLVVAAGAGGSVPVLVVAALHLTIFGLHRGLYLEQSAETGFEWRLIPLHWVTIFVSPLPELPGEFSLAQTFPLIVPGVAGMIGCLIACRGRARFRHALVIGAVTLHCLLYLAYRDLHPQGLFRFSTYHYFKWCIPFFGLYAVSLMIEVARSPRRWAAWSAGLAVVVALFSWRVTWREATPSTQRQPVVRNARALALAEAPRSVLDGVYVPASGGFSDIYLNSYTMTVGSTIFHANADFKAFPYRDGLIFTVLRPIPPGPATVTFAKGVSLVGEPRLVRAGLRFRWPHLTGVALTFYRRWFETGL